MRIDPFPTFEVMQEQSQCIGMVELWVFKYEDADRFFWVRSSVVLRQRFKRQFESLGQGNLVCDQANDLPR